MFLITKICLGQESKPDSCKITRNHLGKPLLESCYKDGFLHGSYKSYYHNGRLEKAGTFNKSLKEGAWIEWYDNGSKFSEGVYKNNLKEGIWTNYDLSGKTKQKVTFTNNIQSGLFQSYYQNGVIMEEGNYIKLGASDYDSMMVDKNRQHVKCEDYNVFDARIGVWKYYHNNGSIKSTGVFIPQCLCYSTIQEKFNKELKANLVSTVVEIEYLKDGHWKYFDRKGKLSKEEVFKKGKLVK